MKRFIAAAFVIFCAVNFTAAQSRRAVNYSESQTDETNDKKRRARQNEAPQTVERLTERKLPANAAANGGADADVIRVDTELVVIPARISSRDGRVVAGLKREEFKIYENGVEQEIAYFSDEEQPFTVALVLDMSYSSVFKLREIQDAALEFINRQLRPRDRVMVVSVDERVKVLCEPTNNRQALRYAVEATKIASGTSFYQALDLVLNEKLTRVAGRKAIVVFSDGVDTTSRSVKPEKLLKDIGENGGDTLVFPIEYDTYADVLKTKKETAQIFYDDDDRPYAIETPPASGERREDYKRARRFLEDFSEASGGRLYRVSTSTNLSDAFAAIADELRKTYSLGYYPSGERKNATRYAVNVRVYRPNLIVRARNNYLWRQN